MTRTIGGVEYGEAAFEHMRELYALAHQRLDGELEQAIVDEAAVIHEFHVHFPGVEMKDKPGA